MGNWTSTGLITILLLISLMLIGMTVTSIITGDSTGVSTDGTTDSSIEDNIDQIIDETMDEITSYIQIRDQKGKFYKNNEIFEIQKIAILISPLVSQEIDLTQLNIQIENDEIVRILSYNGNSSNLESQTLFEHSIWDQLNDENFGFITICDIDNSIINNSLINDYSDNAYLIFRLPSDMTMNKYDILKVTLFPSSGITRVTTLKAPMPMNLVVTFD